MGFSVYGPALNYGTDAASLHHSSQVLLLRRVRGVVVWCWLCQGTIFIASSSSPKPSRRAWVHHLLQLRAILVADRELVVVFSTRKRALKTATTLSKHRVTELGS